MLFDRRRVGQVVHWTARAISLFSMFVLLLFIFGEGEPFQVTKIRAVEWLGLMLFPVGVVVGFVVAWWREGLGGGITVTSLLAFYLVFEFLLNGKLTQGVWFFVFAFPGFLFLISWFISRPRRPVAI
jgi:hypothetical protein